MFEGIVCLFEEAASNLTWPSPEDTDSHSIASTVGSSSSDCSGDECNTSSELIIKSIEEEPLDGTFHVDDDESYFDNEDKFESWCCCFGAGRRRKEF